MSGRNIACIILLAGMLLMVGCSGGSVTTPTPLDTGNVAAPLKETESNRMLWGIWEISFDPGSLGVVIVPIRNPQVHFDVTHMLLPPNCNDCIKININSFDPVTRILDADVTLRNPTAVSGYDVRGILYTNYAGHELTNADDWTDFWDIPGGASINPFRTFAKDETKRKFLKAAEHTEKYLVYIPDPPQYGAIQYAVDASWPGNCRDPYEIYDQIIYGELDDLGFNTVQFYVYVKDWQDDVEWVKLDVAPLGAPEPLMLEPTAGNGWRVIFSNEWLATAGDYKLNIHAKSENNLHILYDTMVFPISFTPNTPPEWDDTVGITSAQSGYEIVTVTYGTASDPQFDPVHYNLYYVDSEDDTDPFEGAGHIKLEDIGSSPYIVTELTNGHTYHFGVRASDDKDAEDGNTVQEIATPHDNTGWVRQIGGTGYDFGRDTIVDEFGNIYITGEFQGDVDFDPGPGEDEHEAGGTFSAFLCKLDPDGNFLWAVTWGADEWASHCIGGQLALDESGYVYVYGFFVDTVDFDPGPGIDEQEVEGATGFNLFLSKFDTEGNYQWARVWGDVGTMYTTTYIGLDVDGTSHVYVSGYFDDTVDFDPGPGVTESTSVNGADIFLSKFDTNGEFEWVRTWGGEFDYDDYIGYRESGTGVVLDSLGYIYVTGIFGDTVDFDPGPEVDERTATDPCDAFLSKFDSSGNYIWAQTWGNSGWSIAIDGDDFTYVTGTDDDGGYVAKFNTAGELQTSWHWGVIYPIEVTVDNNSDIFTAGVFPGTVDFDPGPGVLEFTSEGIYDAFLCKIDSGGGLEWARVWGNEEYDWAGAVAVNSVGDSFVPGAFGETVDFFFGPGVDERTSFGDYDIFLVKYPPDGNW